ncbi:hypothetical protein SADUNF_Sadunf10G0072200 [Salix dunnii]|uniref:FAF domain-containing protein n=1 Tax=Salix dunnii TaxID=1413687 RepID=A0A835JQ66_9ROSI|nr:hypothetical protein SADUNF_Sadunf10G0072200 [Salix dunnii]
MATMVCQGLQSCLESPIVESRALRLRLSSPNPYFAQSLELALKPCLLDSDSKEVSGKCHYEETSHKTGFLYDKHTSPDLGGLSFLQVLSTGPEGPKESMGEGNIYVHPLINRSSSMLSGKSLELCTESLGSESGSDMTESSIFTLSSPDSRAGISPSREQQKSRQLLGAKKANSRSFPPPLTTMSESKSLQVRAHREDGRLIIRAVEAPSRHSYLHAERRDGHLRLSFIKDSTSDFDSTGVASTEKNEGSNKEGELENDMDYDESDDSDVGESGNGALFEDEAESTDDLDVDTDMGMEECRRPTRCKEGETEKNGLLNWEPFWVATS